ncbi:MAG: NAD(P)-dependent oxidoreductase [Erythrobacter sp.]|uniref:precorrin-2 dehydrogenase/sirohydrochlorin ferrochelatase family protein n=1 Tax=Erythrobacter sp. TaxID=1042 RepID=UPI003C70AC81
MSELASLPLFHRIAGQRVLVLGEGPAAEAKQRLVERAGGTVIDDRQRAVDEGVRIAFIAYEDAKACQVDAINCRCAGMLVNVVDRPDLCDFTTPSILDRDPVLIAIGTDGTSAGLAKHVRLRLERMLPQSLGRLARALYAARPALRARFPDGGERRRAIDAALREGGVLDPLDPDAHRRVTEWSDRATAAPAVEGKDERAPKAGLAMFELASDDPEDLTLRQARLLGEADAVCTQGPVPSSILTRARADAQRFECDLEACPNAQRSSDRQPNGPCLRTAQAPSSLHLTVILRASQHRPID